MLIMLRDQQLIPSQGGIMVKSPLVLLLSTPQFRHPSCSIETFEILLFGVLSFLFPSEEICRAGGHV